MIRYENECVGCPPERGCLGSGCPNRNVPYYYCDKCGDDAEYNFDGEDLCEDCLLEKFNKVTCDNCHCIDELYAYDGLLLCVECLLKEFKIE